MRILVAEDQPIHARLLEVMLEELGHQMVHAGDGAEAWRLLSADDRPALALIDWMMPGMSGVELCRRIRAEPALAGVYVILLTARDTTDDVVEGLGAGANDFVTKPFEPRELAARLQVGVRVLELEAALAARVEEKRRALAERAAAMEALRAAMAREVAVADRIQQSLLFGSPPSRPELEIAALSAPSQGVDGDFYDFLDCTATHLDVLVGDVMGKGIPAALAGAATKSHVLRALALGHRIGGETDTPAGIIDAVSRSAGPRFVELESFATLVYARIDLARDEIRLVDAGHPPTLLVRGDTGAVEELSGIDPPLGIWEEQTFTEVRAPFRCGDVAVFYSDGVTEAASPAGELFGVARLKALLGEARGASANDLVARIRAAASSHAGGGPMSDDLTCVVVRRRELAGSRPPVRTASATSSVDLPASLDELGRVRSLIEEVCGSGCLRFREEQVAALLLAVNEAFVNVVEHAYAGVADGRVRLETECGGEVLEVRMVHRGASFDPETVPPPSFDGSRDGGFGVYLIAASVDEVAYEDLPGGERVIRLRKRGLAAPGGGIGVSAH